MSFTNSANSLFEPYHIYYDLNITNNDTTNRNAKPFLEFNETRSNPILDNPSNYFVSVVRFSLETPSLPLFIPSIELPSTDANNLNYFITMGVYDATATWREVQQQLIWTPEDLNAVKPNPASFQNMEGDYYHCYSYTHFIYNVVNKALADCYRGLALIIGAGLNPNFQPYMTWDSTTDKATLWANAQYFDQIEPYERTAPFNVAGNYVRLYFNQSLYNLFSSFEAYINKQSGNPTTATTGVGRKDYIIKIYNQNNTNLGSLPFNGGSAVPPAVSNYNGSFNVSPFLPYSQPPTAITIPLAPYSATFIFMRQEYTTTPLWNPVSNITFTTSLLPVNPNLISTPLIYNAPNSVGATSLSNIANVLTDLEAPLVFGRDYKPNILYVPQSEYRLIDLNGNVPLSAIQIGVFWRDSFGNLHPFYLLAGNSATIKLMFRRKDFQTTTQLNQDL